MKYHLNNPFDLLEAVDLYRSALSVRNYFPLSSMRQKDLEQFFGIGRKDEKDGGELICIYHNYVKNHNPEDLKLLILHNRDDLLGMCSLLAIRSYLALADGDWCIHKIDQEQDTLDVVVNLTSPLPSAIMLKNESGTFYARSSRGIFHFPVYQEQLRHYFPDPENYYWLPQEQSVVHKSVGRFVDPAFREKASPDNCYVAKLCHFLRQELSESPSYMKKSRKDKRRYLILPETWLKESSNNDENDKKTARALRPGRESSSVFINNDLYDFLQFWLQNYPKS